MHMRVRAPRAMRPWVCFFEIEYRKIMKSPMATAKVPTITTGKLMLTYAAWPDQVHPTANPFDTISSLPRDFVLVEQTEGKAARLLKIAHVQRAGDGAKVYFIEMVITAGVAGNPINIKELGKPG